MCTFLRGRCILCVLPQSSQDWGSCLLHFFDPCFCSSCKVNKIYHAGELGTWAVPASGFGREEMFFSFFASFFLSMSLHPATASYLWERELGSQQMAVAAVLLLTLSKPELRSLIYVLVLLAFKTKIMAILKAVGPYSSQATQGFHHTTRCQTTEKQAPDKCKIWKGRMIPLNRQSV